MILKDGNVTIFIFDFENLKKHYRFFAQLLSDNEIDKGKKFTNKEDRVRFVVGRGVTRLLLALEIKCPFERLNILYKKHGKPYIENSNLYFNVSHNMKYFVIGISNREIGVDIEEIKKIKNIELLINRTMDRKMLKGLTKKEVHTRFIEDWVIKESYLKYLGCGLTKPISDVKYYLFKQNNNSEVYLHEKNIYTKKIILKNEHILCYSNYCNK